MRLDLRVQRGYGFLYAALFSALVWIGLLRALPAEWLPLLLPVGLFVDLSVVGFYFLAALVLLEKHQATVQALAVTPLRFAEYLAAKLVTLTLLALLVSVLVVAGVGWPPLDLPLLLAGTALMSLISLLVGFSAAAPFGSFTSFLIPSQLCALLLYAPLVEHFGWWRSPLVHLLPSHGALVLLRGAFTGVAPPEVAVALLTGLGWIAGLAWLARAGHRRYVLRVEGA
jgi:fluoroquinolone transport system permease protein